ncbi:MAG: hypothetical protein R2685_01465 [Candidatus Nitrosocosmicus sp.]|nr:hypothetical protein F1Z66_04290 [Candidatus Nitrosocosmicus sp. SS]MDR4489556.1 hypothetical protein [Candidatus Nitrosocosmicus sp.]
MVKARALVNVSATATVRKNKPNPSSTNGTFTDSILVLCSTENCLNSVTARCTICLEYCCYDHAFLHKHSMESLEIIK